MLEVLMADYIVCHKKRNAPRMNVYICQKKCPFKNECEGYLAHIKTQVNRKHASISPENPSLALAAS